jgi:uncharacterized membrane protein
MYTALLTLHSYLRWVVILLALLVVVRAISGVVQRRPWTPADDSAAKWFGMGLDIQMVIGLIIYFFLSPFTMSAWGDIGAAMRDPSTRFIVIEHQFGMIIAVALTHIGRARIRKSRDSAQRHRTALIFFGLATVVMLASIPWPGRPSGRPLLRGFGDE